MSAIKVEASATYDGYRKWNNVDIFFPQKYVNK